VSDVLKICKNCENSFTGFGESSMCLGLRCSEHDKAVNDNDTCSLFELSSHHLVNQLKQQLAERDELIIELSDKVDFYGETSNWCHTVDSSIGSFHATIEGGDCEKFKSILTGGKLARTPLKNQTLLDEIKGRV